MSSRRPETARSELLAECRQLERVYSQGALEVTALGGVDLSIQHGEYLAIMGTSGSGKSTLMNILGCLDRPTRGEYLLTGRHVEGMEDDELSSLRGRTIGFVFQTFNLLPRLDAVDNAALPLIYAGVPVKERRARALEVLEQVGLADRSSHRPNELSGGQRQRVAIARALINRPELLLADEPTGNLDSKTSEEVMELLDELHRGGTTVVIVTHEEEIARHCARRLVMRDGHVVSDDVVRPGSLG
ncbi:MAG: ABC transporter ATP-binding protein [Acidobacteriota bacterium]